MVATSYSPHVLSWQFSDSRSQQQGERKYGIISLCIPSFLLTCQICLVEQSYWLSLQSIKLSGGTWYTFTIHPADTAREPHTMCCCTNTDACKAERLKCTNSDKHVTDWASYYDISLEKMCQVVWSSFLFCRRQNCTKMIDIIPPFQVK